MSPLPGFTVLQPCGAVGQQVDQDCTLSSKTIPQAVLTKFQMLHRVWALLGGVSLLMYHPFLQLANLLSWLDVALLVVVLRYISLDLP